MSYGTADKKGIKNNGKLLENTERVVEAPHCLERVLALIQIQEAALHLNTLRDGPRTAHVQGALAVVVLLVPVIVDLQERRFPHD